MMDRSRLEILPRVWLDHRRAVFLEEHSTLAVADLHLGYAWAHRFNGQMLPLQPGDAILERLNDLCSSYQPRAITLLGDIVHEAVPVKEIAQELVELLKTLSAKCSVRLVLGNHDKSLKKAVLKTDSIELHRSVRTGNFLLLHGHEPPAEKDAAMMIMGHEHPAISLGDGIKSAKFPCFLVSEKLLVLPPFSGWAAGSNLRAYQLMSPLARAARFTKAVAICGPKLLPVHL